MALESKSYYERLQLENLRIRNENNGMLARSDASRKAKKDYAVADLNWTYYTNIVNRLSIYEKEKDFEKKLQHMQRAEEYQRMLSSFVSPIIIAEQVASNFVNTDDIIKSIKSEIDDISVILSFDSKLSRHMESVTAEMKKAIHPYEKNKEKTFEELAINYKKTILSKNKNDSNIAAIYDYIAHIKTEYRPDREVSVKKNIDQNEIHSLAYDGYLTQCREYAELEPAFKNGLEKPTPALRGLIQRLDKYEYAFGQINSLIGTIKGVHI